MWAATLRTRFLITALTLGTAPVLAASPSPSSSERRDSFDGIPSIDAPRFDTAGTTPFSSREEVIGVVLGGEANLCTTLGPGSNRKVLHPLL